MYHLITSSLECVQLWLATKHIVHLYHIINFDVFYICDIYQPSTRTCVNWTFSSCNRAISSQPQAFGISKTGWFLCPRNKKKTNNYWDLIFFMNMSLCFYVLTTSSRKGWKIDLAACDWHLCPWDTSHLVGPTSVQAYLDRALLFCISSSIWNFRNFCNACALFRSFDWTCILHFAFCRAWHRYMYQCTWRYINSNSIQM